MKARLISVAISTLALGLALGCTAQADASPTQQASGSSQSASQVAAAPDQARIADTTWKLESAFSDQFVKGRIDRAALAPLVDDVVQALPEPVRSQAQTHIEGVIAKGEQAATHMTPEQRAQLATPPTAEKAGKAMIQIIGYWGWPGYAGWNGFGAFGFPYTSWNWGWNGLGWNGLYNGYWGWPSTYSYWGYPGSYSWGGWW
jgi:hypothetical protein